MWHPARWLHVGLIVGLAACAAPRGGDDPLPIGSPCDDARPCGGGQRCLAGRCAQDYGTCSGRDSDCLNDSYCACPPAVPGAECLCVPWGQPPRGDRDVNCSTAAFPPGAFKNPVLRCQWPPTNMAPPGYKDVPSTPLVADLDGDKQPEIIFVAGFLGVTHLVAISGKDCSVVFDKAQPLIGCSDLAIGDLDGDGVPEIVGMTGVLTGGLTVFDNRGNKLANIGAPGQQNCAVGYPPLIANVDGEGPPEIVAGATVARFTRQPMPKLEVLWQKSDGNGMADSWGGTWGAISVAEDLDGDGRMEVIAGNRVFDGLTGQDKTPSALRALRGGFPAIGDFNGDGKPDIVLVSSAKDVPQEVAIVDFAGNQTLMRSTINGSSWGGAPTVADFDGDGKPEFATAGPRLYSVFSPRCVGQPRPAACKGGDDGALWQSQVQDESSGATGSSVFDFNGDGVAEVVYRDECWLRVYNGPDGRKLFAAPVTSGTSLELPVIADTDNDGHADIVVSSDGIQGQNCTGALSRSELGIDHGGPTFGVRVYKDPEDRWMPSRGIWNQHSYHITNVNDDGTIPLKEEANHKRYNNYRQNVQGTRGSGTPVGDGTGVIIAPVDPGDCVGVWRLSANVCNRGTAPLPAGLPATFYSADPRVGSAPPLCTGNTMRPVEPGRCGLLQCEWRSPPQEPVDLWLRVNDDGRGGAPAMECHGDNNVAHLARAICQRAPG